jgi:exopolysaccharide biosynthesis polyprenyl glycosylphosphotransferase
LKRAVPVHSILFLAVAFPIGFYAAGLYERRSDGDRAMFLARLIVATLTVIMIVGPASYLVRRILLPRSYVGMQILLVLAIFPWYRALLNTILKATNIPLRIAVIGGGKAGTALMDALSRSEDYKVVGVYDDDPARLGAVVHDARVVGTSDKVLSDDADPEIVAVAVTHQKSPALMQTLLECRRRGIRITDMVTPFELIMGRLPVEHLSDTWIAFFSNFSPLQGQLQSKMKRATDVIGAILFLVIAAIPIAVSALLIKLTSEGPVFYRQRRVGLDGRTFRIVKLRTMRCDAEEEGLQWATENDERITSVGRYLRRLRIDELPQLWNVLRGDMSLTGPRPERPEFVHVLEKSIPYYTLRHMVKPGLTGWAQVSYPYGASIFDARMKLEYDLYYIRHMGPIFDLRILLRTVHALLFGGGR